MRSPCSLGRRHGSNPGTVGLAGQRVPIRVPRIRHVTESEIPLRSYEALHGDRAVNDLLLRRVLYGISCRNYEAAAEVIPGAIGLSGSTVSRAFIEASVAKLRELQERDLSREDVVALVLDGKTFAESTMVVALGITMTGEKRFLGFVETDTENEKVLTPFLRSLVERGLDVSQGLLLILDGGKGLRAAVRKAFRHRALVQRCQWHKRENGVSYLAKSEQPAWRQRLQRAYNRPEYDEALAALQSLQHELEDRNQSAADSLAEGLDETLTLHRLGVYGVLGRSLKPTNGLESITALIEERCAKVDHWQHSSQRHRWLATALLDIEPRLRRPRFSWTRIKGESDVHGGWEHGSVKEREGTWVGADGGSPEGDWSARRRRGRAGRGPWRRGNGGARAASGTLCCDCCVGSRSTRCRVRSGSSYIAWRRGRSGPWPVSSLG